MWRRWAVLTVIVAFPAACWWLAILDHNRGLIWIVPHQLYYYPLSWLGPPFFEPDGDTIFWVRWQGRILTAAVYVACFFLANHLIGRKRRRLESAGGA